MFEGDALERVAQNIEKKHDSARFVGGVSEHFISRFFKTLLDFSGGTTDESKAPNRMSDDDKPKGPNER